MIHNVYLLIILHVIADFIIAITFFSIAAMLLWFRKWFILQSVKSALILFALVFITSGVAHFINSFVIWYRIYWVWAVVKLSAAFVSMVIAFLLYRMLWHTRKLEKPD